jgi:cysteine synthase A
VIAAEPDNAQVLGSRIPQPRAADGSPSASHPHFRPHLMQGWAPDFISRLTETAVTENLVDEIIPVAGGEAMRLARELAQREGIFVGTSSGATLAAALEIAKRSPAGTNIVCMLPDTGERYLSTPLFEHIGEEMNDEELALSRSTPGYRFDPPDACPLPSAPVVQGPVDPEAARFVARVIEEEPVVLFALEWCEFCWSVRKLFARMNVKYRSIDLDSVALQAGDRGGKIRAALGERIGRPTIPQVFVAGRHIGGCTELFDAVRDGSLRGWMSEHNIPFDATVDIDPDELLPKWVQPRKTA